MLHKRLSGMRTAPPDPEQGMTALTEVPFLVTVPLLVELRRLSGSSMGWGTVPAQHALDRHHSSSE